MCFMAASVISACILNMRTMRSRSQRAIGGLNVLRHSESHDVVSFWDYYGLFLFQHGRGTFFQHVCILLSSIHMKIVFMCRERVLGEKPITHRKLSCSQLSRGRRVWQNCIPRCDCNICCGSLRCGIEMATVFATVRITLRSSIRNRFLVDSKTVSTPRVHGRSRCGRRAQWKLCQQRN